MTALHQSMVEDKNVNALGVDKEVSIMHAPCETALHHLSQGLDHEQTV